jgi:hypothetical protein
MGFIAKLLLQHRPTLASKHVVHNTKALKCYLCLLMGVIIN